MITITTSSSSSVNPGHRLESDPPEVRNLDVTAFPRFIACTGAPLPDIR
jgi:hypothetical protein